MNSSQTTYDWTYFKNKYEKYIKKDNTDNRKMESVLKKRKYGDAFDQDTFEFMRFGEIVGDKYVFKLPLYELHIPLYENCNEKIGKSDDNKMNIEEDLRENENQDENKNDSDNENEGIKIIIEEKEQEVKEEQEEQEVEEEQEVKEEPNEGEFNYDNIKESVDKNIWILIDQIAAVYGFCNIKNRVETLY